MNEETESSWDLQEGDEIAPGLLALEKLGGGHDYEAYLGWDETLFSLVVAKCLRPHRVEESHARRVLMREADILRRLSHPVVVRLFRASVDGTRPHIALEYLEGPHLARLIRRFGALPLEQLLPLALQICSALFYLRREDLVHLDVKPRNIVMTAPPRLIDFSVARTIEDARALKSSVGTDAYMAPEQCDPERAPVGPEADVWGLGATLFHAATGDRPWPRPKDYDRDDPKQRWPQLVEPAPVAERLPRRLAVLIARCLVPAPEGRPVPDEIAEMLEPLVAKLPRRPLLGRLRPRMR